MSLRSFTQSTALPSFAPLPLKAEPTGRFPAAPSSREVPLDYVVFSHLRWDFVFQRPQHLLTRCALLHRVFFVEEPVFEASGCTPYLDIGKRTENLSVVVPHLPEGMSEEAVVSALRKLTNSLISTAKITNYVCWYYTPMALPFTRYLEPAAVIYDCMDELSLFKGAPVSLLDLERQLFVEADVVFTGGRTLFEHKKAHHSNIHAFPSSIDVPHFEKARAADLMEAVDQREIQGPKIGFFGVIDERMNLDLLSAIATEHPEWNLVMVGPTVKIDPAKLPRASNIHYLDSKSYEELPSYIRGWDVAILPFALNDSTKFISPTKTPEYLAAGVPVVSTSIRDVVFPYGDKGLALVADEQQDFIRAIENHLSMTPENTAAWLGEVDNFLADLSWDRTWKEMRELIISAANAPAAETPDNQISPPFTTTLSLLTVNQRAAS